MKSHFITLIALIISAFPVIDSVDLCGFEPFNAADNICCDGKPAPRFFKGSEQRCCGDLLLYQHPSQKCCGTQVRNVSELESGEFECCGDEYVWKAGNEFCCDDRSYKPRDFKKTPVIIRSAPVDPEPSAICPVSSQNSTHTRDTDCCGRIPYYESQALCCKGEIRSRIYMNSSCCGTGVYDKENQVCNDDYEILRKLPDFFHWCGEMEYDNRTSVCCKDNIIDKPKEYGLEETPPCCGNAVLNEKQDNQSCSRGKVVPKGHVWCNTGPVHPVKGRCCNGVIYKEVQPSAACCGSNLIKKPEKCCNDKIGYDPNIKRCCGDSIIKISDRCCGEQIENRTGQVCCKNRFGREYLVNKTNEKQNECCAGLLYDRLTEECSGGIIRKKVNEKDLRCGGVVYEGVKGKGFMCCYKRKYKTKRQGCCGKIVYNLGRQECLGGTVRDRVSPNDRGIMNKIICLPKANWTDISEVNIDCQSTGVFIMKKRKEKRYRKQKQKGKKKRSIFRMKQVLVGHTVKGNKNWRLRKCFRQLVRSFSFILISNNVTSPIRGASFVENNKRNRRFFKNKCKSKVKS